MRRYQNEGLGFNVDWGGIVGNAVQAYGSIQQSRHALALQRAQLTADLRAREIENQQLIQRRRAEANAGQQQQQSSHGGGVWRGSSQSSASSFPPWVIPAAVGVGVLALVFLMRK